MELKATKSLTSVAKLRDHFAHIYNDSVDKRANDLKVVPETRGRAKSSAEKEELAKWVRTWKPSW
jgi:hypothetical protein